MYVHLYVRLYYLLGTYNIQHNICINMLHLRILYLYNVQLIILIA